MVTNKVRTYALGFQNSINPMLSLGHEIVWAADFSGYTGDLAEIPCKIFQISINTLPFRPCNIKALIQLVRIIKEEKIEAVVCSTPIGGLLARIAAKIRGIRPVIYEAHGFLFFDGAPLINRTIYKLEELALAHWTDALITITQEDFQNAQGFKLRSGRGPYLVHGAGVNTGVKVSINRLEKRKELGIPKEAFLIVSAGELNRNKNTKVVIKAIAEMNDSSIHYAVCGVGEEKDNLDKMARGYGISGQIHFLGYRMDVAEVMHASDVFTIPSFREGVPRALLEAMDLGLPCVGSDTRGISDLIENGRNGYLCDPRRPGDYAGAFRKIRFDKDWRMKVAEVNKAKVRQYSAEVVREELKDIYKEVLRR